MLIPLPTRAPVSPTHGRGALTRTDVGPGSLLPLYHEGFRDGYLAGYRDALEGVPLDGAAGFGIEAGKDTREKIDRATTALNTTGAVGAGLFGLLVGVLLTWNLRS